MGTILVVAEIQKGAIREASFELVSFAQKLRLATVTSLVIGSGIAARWPRSSRRRAAATVYARRRRRARELQRRRLTRARSGRRSPLRRRRSCCSRTRRAAGTSRRASRPASTRASSATAFRRLEDGKLVFVRRVFNGKLDARVVPTGGASVATVQPGATAPSRAPATARSRSSAVESRPGLRAQVRRDRRSPRRRAST